VRNGQIQCRVVIAPLSAGGISVPAGTLAQPGAVAPVWQYTAGLTWSVPEVIRKFSRASGAGMLEIVVLGAPVVTAPHQQWPVRPPLAPGTRAWPR
jgi:hypothetical protein